MELELDLMITEEECNEAEESLNELKDDIRKISIICHNKGIASNDCNHMTHTST
jgi:hypothetical protein